MVWVCQERGGGEGGGEGTLGLKVMSMEAKSPLLTNGRECNVHWQNGECLQKFDSAKALLLTCRCAAAC